ncbi:MAG: hypothetical protein OXD33_10795 [Rhodobacteraceae bacterium]|nr:hypothetical protein [Paracoccaceae bacterium]
MRFFIALISRGNRTPLRQVVSCAFYHKDMRSISKSLAAGTPPDRISAAFSPMPINPTLKSVAQAFLDLQEARHQADYNSYRLFTRREAIYNHHLAVHAIHDWAKIRKTSQADAYLTSLLLIDRIQGS